MSLPTPWNRGGVADGDWEVLIAIADADEEDVMDCALVVLLLKFYYILNKHCS